MLKIFQAFYKQIFPELNKQIFNASKTFGLHPVRHNFDY
jgi:hypothetical protein